MARASGGANNMHPLSGWGAQMEKIRFFEFPAAGSKPKIIYDNFWSTRTNV